MKAAGKAIRIFFSREEWMKRNPLAIANGTGLKDFPDPSGNLLVFGKHDRYGFDDSSRAFANALRCATLEHDRDHATPSDPEIARKVARFLEFEMQSKNS